MRRQFTNLLATAGILLAAIAVDAMGQENLPFGPSNYEHDFQLFAPLELDLDNSQEDQYSGYFFDYQKLFWSYSGERVTVGNTDPNIIEFAEQIYRRVPSVDDQVLGPPSVPPPVYNVNALPPPDPSTQANIIPLPPRIFNTLTDVPPDAGFAFGNRYELGYRDADNGWLIGILDGPELNQGRFYGFQRNIIPTLGGLPPFIEPDYTDATDIGPGTGGTAGGDLRAFGFGSVPVLFDAADGYLVGFRDYLNVFGSALIGTQGGPFLYVGNYGLTQEVSDDDPEIPFFRLADDIDRDGIIGSVAIIVTENITVQTPTGPVVVAVPVIKEVIDFDDLHRFNIFFDNVLVRSSTEIDGVEAMWSHTLTKRHYMKKFQNNEVTFSWGARFLRVYDDFRVDAEGSILHDGFWDTSFTNQIVGPQLALKWVNRRQRWTLAADGRFMFGYNQADWDQLGLMGEGQVPGALNQALYGRATAFSHGLIEREFSPVAELRLQANYNFTRSFSMKFGYTGQFVGNIRRAAPSVFYHLPDMGYRDAGTQDLLINGFDLGVEFVH